MNIAVLCPTRGRPTMFERLCESVLNLSTASLLAYVDADDPHLADYVQIKHDRIKVVLGSRIFPGPAVNYLCSQNPQFSHFVVIPDDARLIRNGVLEEAAARLDAWDGIGVAHFDQGKEIKFVNFPMLSKRMVGLLNYFACPTMKWCCYDTMLQVMGTALDRLAIIENAIEHDDIRTAQHDPHFQEDATWAMMYLAMQFERELELLRSEIDKPRITSEVVEA